MNIWRVFYRFRVLDKDLGPSHLVLVVVHVDGPEEVQDSLLLRTPPTWPRLSRQNGIPGQHTPHESLPHWASAVLSFQGTYRGMDTLNSPHQKLFEDSAVSKSGPSYAYVFPQSQVLDLVLDPTSTWNSTIHLEGLPHVWEHVCHSGGANLLSSQSFGLLVSLGLIQRI